MVARTSSISIALVALVALPLGACQGETRYDVFMKGLQIEGDAERGPCKLVQDDGSFGATISGDQVQTCLKRTEEALAEYERAKAMGYDGVDYDRVHTRAQERKQRLESMLTMVRKMEREGGKKAP